MKYILGLIVLIATTMASAGEPVSVDRLINHCLAPEANEDVVKAQSFPFTAKTDLAILKERYQRLYDSGQRLKDRAYYDPQTQKIQIKVIGQLAEVSPLFIVSIAAQIQNAFALRYADLAFFSDMGHVHYHIPQKIWDEKFASIPISERGRLYTALMAEPEVKNLYHTAEQLTMVDENNVLLSDRYLLWRYFSRNIVGPNDGSGELQVVLNPDFDRFNSVSSLPGHFLYSAGVYIHATKNGCFSFEHEGQVSHFDISYEYFPY